MNKRNLAAALLAATGLVVALSACAPADAKTGSQAKPDEAGTSSSSTTQAAPVKKETKAQANAREKAADYLDYSAFSRKGLIRQLVSGEGFSTKDATYGVDALHANWNTQAAKKAKDYLDYDSFSHAGLIRQLVSGESFTPAQAAYGVKKAGL